MSETQQKQLPSSTGAANKASQTDYIDLTELFFKLIEHWKLLLSLALICGIGAGLYTHFLITPLYRATSTIYVLSRRDSAINMSDLQIGTALTSDYIKVFKMWEVHGEVIDNLDLPYNYSQMQNMLSVTNDANTRITGRVPDKSDQVIYMIYHIPICPDDSQLTWHILHS